MMNPKKIKVIAFIEALIAFDNDHKETQKYLKDQRLTQTEKKILECWLLLRDRDFNEILALMPKLVVDYDQLVSSQKNLIWGITHNNRNEYDQALPLIKQAYEEIQSYEVPHLEFKVIHNLFTVYFNLKNSKAMLETLQALEELPTENQKQMITCWQCRFSYHSFLGEMAKAGEVLDELENVSSAMSELQLIAHQINKFIFFAKLESFDQCEGVLQAMKKNRKFQASSNFIYMRSMLSHLHKNKPLYVYQRDFDGHPFLFHQLKVIQSLEAANQAEALDHWRQLRQLDPRTFKGNFQYAGDKSVFSLALDKYTQSMTDCDEIEVGEGNKEEILLSFLMNAKSPVRKEMLHEKIWGRPLLDKGDSIKLQKLVSRVRQKTGADIQFKKECYHLLALKKSA